SSIRRFHRMESKWHSSGMEMPAGTTFIQSCCMSAIPSALRSEMATIFIPHGLPTGSFSRHAEGESAHGRPCLGWTVRKLQDLTPSEVGTWRADATQMYGNPGPAWSPGGAYLAVTDYPDSKTGGALILISPEGVRLRQLTRPPAGIHDFSPAFSPNGRTLA